MFCLYLKTVTLTDSIYHNMSISRLLKQMLFIFSILPDPFVLSITCDTLNGSSRLFCEETTGLLVRGGECAKTSQYCRSLSVLLQGTSCDTKSVSTAAERTVCRLIQQGYLSGKNACDSPPIQGIDKVTAGSYANYCAMGAFLKTNFPQFTEKREENILTGQFSALVGKLCKRKNDCSVNQPLSRTASRLADFFVKKVKGGCSQAEAQKAIDLCVKGYPLIHEKSKQRISAEDLARFFVGLTLGIEKNRALFDSRNPDLYEARKKIGDFTLPCAIKTHENSSELFLYLDKMTIPTSHGEEEILLDPIGEGTNKVARLAMSYSQPQLLVKADFFAARRLPDGSIQKGPPDDMTRYKAQEEYAVAKVFNGEPYIASVSALFAPSYEKSITSIQPYYPLSGGQLHDVLQLETADIVDGVSKEKFLSRFGARVLQGINTLHGKGFVHRDIKPENIRAVRDEHGEIVPKIIDFGLTLQVSGPQSVPGDDGPQHGRRIRSKESPFFLSWEVQAVSQDHELTHRLNIPIHMKLILAHRRLKPQIPGAQNYWDCTKTIQKF